MNLEQLALSPWAIRVDSLVDLREIYARHRRGEVANFAAIEARLGRRLSNAQPDYRLLEGGVALLPISGVIMPKASLLTQVSGATSAQAIEAQLEAAVADTKVRSIVLAIDSPGGSVFGTPELAATVRRLASQKSIVTLSDGMLASAAYWVGSAADAIFVSGPTVDVGSIGIVATHTYQPAADGRVTSEITAGKYKRIDSKSQPLSSDGQAYMQEQVDYLYGVFVDAVAEHRGVSASKVLDRMADGRVFIGQQAVSAGLVDGIKPLSALIAELASDPRRYAKRLNTSSVALANQTARPSSAPPLAQAMAADGFKAYLKAMAGPTPASPPAAAPPDPRAENRAAGKAVAALFYKLNPPSGSKGSR